MSASSQKRTPLGGVRLARSTFQLCFKVIHKLTHLVARTELDCLVVLVNSDRVTRRPVVDFASSYRLFSAVCIGYMNGAFDHGSPVRALA